MKKLKYFTVVGGAAVLALGAAAHFFYEWSGNNFFVGMFSPVNESVWEHMKLAFFPMLLFSGATIPYELFPKGLQHIADFLPLSQGIQLMTAISTGNRVEHIYGIIVLVAITVVCTAISLKTFRWE